MELQVGVKVLLKNEQGKYLLIRRSPEAYPEVGPTWDIVGGRIELGTTLLENLRREVKEEIGLYLKGGPTLIAAQDILRDGKRHIVRLTYKGVIDGTPRLDSDHTEFKWVSLKEMKHVKPLDSYVRELLDKGLV